MGDTESDISRRRALQSISAVTGVAVAGCAGLLGGGGDGDGTGGSTPASTSTPPQSPTSAPSSTSTPSPSPTTTLTATPDRPSIERQVVQRDKAAITHVRWAVDGSITWPSFTSYNPVDPTILGDWQGDWIIRFTDDGAFEERGEDFHNQGEYITRNDVLTLHYDTGETVTVAYDVTDGAGAPTLVLSFESGDSLRFRQVADGEDDRGVVQVFRDQTIVREENPTEEGGELKTARAGTGFVISPDGYLVTNAHVVGTDVDPEEALYRRLGVINRRAIRETVERDYDVSDSKKQQIMEVMYDKFISYYAEHSRIRNVSTDVRVLYGTASPDTDLETRSWPARIETTGTVREEVGGEPSWGRDIAILSVDQSPLPTVPLGDATDLGTGEKTFVIGYPDLGIDALFEERNTTLEPTLTSGVVSARRTLNSGVETIQTDAGINNGNSGGPMYNSEGEVIGVATFGPRDVTLQEIQFGLPIDVATGFMGELGVENRPGEVTTAFTEGLSAYWRDDCATVTERMETVLDLWPDHPYAETFIEEC